MLEEEIDYLKSQSVTSSLGMKGSRYHPTDGLDAVGKMGPPSGFNRALQFSRRGYILIDSTPAGPLPQGTLSLGGSFFFSETRP